MNKNLKRLIELLDRSTSYGEFESKVKRFIGWYLGAEFRMWTNADLKSFYVRNGGK